MGVVVVEGIKQRHWDAVKKPHNPCQDGGGLFLSGLIFLYLGNRPGEEGNSC
jgi:hypothetical protein